MHHHGSSDSPGLYHHWSGVFVEGGIGQIHLWQNLDYPDDQQNGDQQC